MHQIRLENAAFEGENNAYLLVGDDGPTTVIDTGIDIPGVEEELRSSFVEHGVEFGDIDQVFLTHFHLDHSGLAGTIQEESGASVFGHADELPLIGNSDDARSALREVYGNGIDDWNVPSDKREELESGLSQARRRAGRDVDAMELGFDRSYATGAGPIRPVSLPGHTLGHVGYQLDNGELVAGDALLPVYTPNIGGADPRVPHPLETYLDTLATIVRLDPGCVWPGHRDRIDEPIERATEIRDHHRDRTKRIITTLAAEGDMNVWELAEALFGSLSSIHILHGPGEAFAHLDHLVAEGVVAERDGRYRLIDEQADHDALVPVLD